jgi:hypothetical protein
MRCKTLGLGASGLVVVCGFMSELGISDLSLIQRLLARCEQLELKVGTLEGKVTALLEREAEDRDTIAALVEVLVDGKQVDAQEITARTEAAVIARRHAASEESSASQSVWDSAAPKTGR